MGGCDNREGDGVILGIVMGVVFGSGGCCVWVMGVVFGRVMRVMLERVMSVMFATEL